MTLLEGMRISDKDLGGKKRENCQLTNLQLFQIILILPFMAKDNIDWRNIIWHIACHLIKAVTIRKDYQKSHLPAVLIVDDSDLPKTGLRMECIGKIFSHVFQRCILGYKLLALVLERRPLAICRGLLDSRREREGRWQGTRSYGPAAREALQPQA